MKKIIFTLFIVLGLFFFLALQASDDELYKASLWGKYDKLIEKIECPDVKLSRNAFWKFGFKEYGFSQNRTWCKDKKGKAAYYVYVKPYWYGWKNINKKFNKIKIASLNGEYSKLLKKLKCRSNSGLYKKFTDYGYTPTQFKGRKIFWCGGYTPPGHFVYLYPHWYVWGEYNFKGVIPDKAKTGKKYKYSELIQVVKCPGGKKQYGEHYEYGGYDQNIILCNQKMAAPGFWVYVYPNWFIWKNREKREYKLDDSYDNWPPR